MPAVIEDAVTNSTYAKEGPWCWITPKDAQLYFWFIEEWVYMFVSFIALSSTLALLCCVTQEHCARYRCKSHIRWDKMIFVPFLIFYTYFLIQFGLLAIEIPARFYNMQNVGLWYTYAIGQPISKLLVVIASLQLMSTSYNKVKKKPSLIDISQDLNDHIATGT